MSLTASQRTLLKTAILASVDPTVIAARVDPRNDVALAAFANSASLTLAWRFSVTRTDLFETMNITQFMALAAPNRDAWALILDTAGLGTPSGGIDASRQKFRNGVVDIWPAAQADNILTACTELATQAQAAIGGTSAISGTVTALRRNFSGVISTSDIGEAMST